MALPNQVLLPRPSDFCRGQLYIGNKACSIGWKSKLFPNMSMADLNRFNRAYKKKAIELGLGSVFDSIAGINDYTKNKLSDVALCFEAGVLALGYVIE